MTVSALRVIALFFGGLHLVTGLVGLLATDLHLQFYGIPDAYWAALRLPWRILSIYRLAGFGFLLSIDTDSVTGWAELLAFQVISCTRFAVQLVAPTPAVWTFPSPFLSFDLILAVLITCVVYALRPKSVKSSPR